MKKQELIDLIAQKGNNLCVGLDSDFHKLPKHLLSLERPVLAFNKAIIEATAPYCVAYKLNTAFYEARGLQGWQDFQDTLALIPKEHFVIADAKRGDIGNTSRAYAEAFFTHYGVDGLTVNPFMGYDSIKPFLEFEGKWAVVLGLTSNQGASDFELLDTDSGIKVYEHVLAKLTQWGSSENIMVVVGATRPQMLKHIRAIMPDYVFLVPGLGTQGGSLEEIMHYGQSAHGAMLINASRSIIFAGTGTNFAQMAEKEAQKLSSLMTRYLKK